MSISKLKLHIAARRLQKDLETLDISSLAVSDYNKKYLETHRKQAAYIMSVYVHILETVLIESSKPMQRISLVDYGAGTGLLGILAKRAGFGRVVYCDIYAVSRDDARQIAAAFGVTLDKYLCGDSTILTIEERDRTDALVSMDVIEHIYNLDTFFEHCSVLGPHLVMVHVSGSNTVNPFAVRKLKRFQKQCEYEGVPAAEGAKQRDLSPSYLEMRRTIIGAQPELELSEKEIEKMAVLTRGFDKKDILKALYDYKVNNRMPIPIAHPTNTCNPDTGNWAERLTGKKEMGDIAKRHGFTRLWMPLYYNTYKPFSLKRLVQQQANILVGLLGKGGLVLSPLVMMVFRKR